MINDVNLDFKIDVPFENLFASKGRTKIIKILAIKNEASITSIVKDSKLNHSNVKSHLKYLLNIGLIQEKRFGRIKIYRYRNELIKAKILKETILFWNNE